MSATSFIFVMMAYSILCAVHACMPSLAGERDVAEVAKHLILATACIAYLYGYTGALS